MTGFTTTSIHGAQLKNDAHGSLRPPVYDTVAFEFANAEDIFPRVLAHIVWYLICTSCVSMR